MGEAHWAFCVGHPKGGFAHARSSIAGALFCIFVLVDFSWAQTSPVLQISTPVNGTIVQPGGSFSVSVTSPAGAALSQVVLVGEEPLDLLEVATGVPLQVTVNVPADSPLRKLELTATGTTAAGQAVESEPVEIDVERADRPVSLTAMMPSMTFQAVGQQIPIILLATFSDGAVLEATESSLVTYASLDTRVVAVSATGMVTSKGPGQASLTVRYRFGTQTVHTVIPVTVAESNLRATPMVLDFGDQNVGTLISRSVTLTNTGSASVELFEVTADGDFTAQGGCVGASPLSSGSSCTETVAFAPSTTGPREAILQVSNSFSSVPVGVPLTGTGVGLQASTTALGSSAAPSVFGQSVTLTATVAGPIGSTVPTGSVTFAEGQTLLGTQPLVNGQAALALATWSVGSHSIVATYSGSESFAPSTSTFTQVVNRASTATSVLTSASPIVLGDPVTFTAGVTSQAPGAGVPTGTVTFRDGAAAMATSAMTNGLASSTATGLTVGSHTVTAVYNGDGNFASSSSTPLTQQVQYQPSGAVCRGEPGHAILQPVNADGTSVFTQGRAVPAKFRVCDRAGQSIGTAGVVQSFQLTQVISGTVSPVNESVPSATPDAAFRWDAVAQQWVFNIGTQGQTAGQTYVYTITLNDGTTIEFRYGLR